MPASPVEPAYVQHDLSCIYCRYNLRGQYVSGACSECGEPVPVSLQTLDGPRPALFGFRFARACGLALLIGVGGAGGLFLAGAAGWVALTREFGFEKSGWLSFGGFVFLLYCCGAGFIWWINAAASWIDARRRPPRLHSQR
jgi:hypothetical protein